MGRASARCIRKILEENMRRKLSHKGCKNALRKNIYIFVAKLLGKYSVNLQIMLAKLQNLSGIFGKIILTKFIKKIFSTNFREIVVQF